MYRVLYSKPHDDAVYTRVFNLWDEVEAFIDLVAWISIDFIPQVDI